MNRGWADYDSSSLEALTAYLTGEERKLFAWLAQEGYTGAGEIVDAGAFLGGSARCFGHGLSRNPRVTDKSGRIHSFDTFRFAPWMRDVPALAGYSTGQSFFGPCHDQLGELDASVTLYPGDITRRSWRGGPIELLMLDCCKTRATNDHCMLEFFPALIPGKSVVLHQDYAIVSRLYWIHASMYALRDRFEFAGVVERGGTAMFRCVAPITRGDVQAIIDAQAGADILDTAKTAASSMRSINARCADAVLESARSHIADPL